MYRRTKNVNHYQLILVDDLINEGKYDLATKKLEELCKNNPNNYIFKLELAKVLILQKKKKLARQYLEELLETDNKNYALLELGNLELDEGNIEKAICCFESLINMENCTIDDYALGLIELGNTQLIINNLEAAKVLFQKVKEIKNCKQKHRDYAKYRLALIESLKGDFDISKMHYKELLSSEYKDEALLGLVKIAAVQNDYTEGLKLLGKISSNTKAIKQYQFYFKYKLGMIHDINNIDGYFCNQLASYSEEDAIKHISFHLDENEKVHNVFNNNIDINDVFEEAKKSLKNNKKLHDGISNIYSIDFGYPIGYWHNYKTSLVKVITIAGTKDIVAIYPDIDENNIKKNKYAQKRTNKTKIYV